MDDQLRVRLLAYRLWEVEGRPDGQAERHWEMASRLVAAERVTDVPPEPVTRKPPEKTEQSAEVPPTVKSTRRKSSTTADKPKSTSKTKATARPRKAAAKADTSDTSSETTPSDDSSTASRTRRKSNRA
ncbi:DUF2934 domain-containing protein [Larsenimonas suaedae]|uniref:DUF2934 domain-containing protein n=1 Tax=Larsenimonas suaedae TaxID=1851019 RepID=A0ABU1GTG7_9GAMM|nr:DUF2934 domain-containing protein [Larsenimonas suaedae]MCM2971756.1 DUF2934 domain-containing protein [Larsenimonas suaedae]MDR5895308.1 DUF2934 domain-containing protein [Larsenimonas suaedae]